MTAPHPVIAAVTARIAARSAQTRAAYLEGIERARQGGQQADETVADPDRPESRAAAIRRIRWTSRCGARSRSRGCAVLGTHAGYYRRT